jgi:predicted CXXCH cytochrome family protein
MEKPYPIKHYEINVNCTGCHNKESHDEKGRAIKEATAETCVSCHSEKERGLIEQWKGDVADFFMEARDMEQEALEALEAAKGKLSEATFQQAMALFQNGQENLRIVDSGGGVHNKKFSVSLLDVAIIHFEDVMDMVKAD